VITEETIQKLTAMKMFTMAKVLRELIETAPGNQLSFEEKIGMLVDREWTERDNRRLARRLKDAKLVVRASLEDVVCEPGRGIDKPTIRQLATCQWVRAKQNVITIGPTGIGKSFLGAALALTLQSVVAVAAGGMLSLLPARPVHIGAGVVMLVSAVVMWRRKSSEAAEAAAVQAEKRPPTFLRALVATFSLIFVAEWGDLTQLGTAALAARYRSPLTVFAAATLALWAVAALAILVGNRARALMNPDLTKRVAAVVFLLLGVALVAGLL